MDNEILLALYARGAFGVPIVTPNLVINVSALPIWAKWQVMPSANYRANFVEVEQSGVLQVTIFVPIGTDDKLINQKADMIVRYFGTQVLHDVSGQKVTIMESRKETALPDSEGKWFMLPISIKYQI